MSLVKENPNEEVGFIYPNVVYLKEKYKDRAISIMNVLGITFQASTSGNIQHESTNGVGRKQ